MTLEQTLQELRFADQQWRDAVREHRQAPPDLGYARRIAQFAAAAQRQADAYKEAIEEGLGWKPIRGVKPAQSAHELQPHSGRRGPAELWEHFDQTLAHLGQALGGDRLEPIAAAYQQLASLSRQLAVAVAEHDGFDVADATEESAQKRAI